MQINLFKQYSLFIVFLLLSTLSKAQVPVANFTLSPSPICSGSVNVVQINDLSTNSPTSWSYTIAQGGGGPGGNTSTLSAQNPTVSFNNQGTYSITLIAGNSSGNSSPVTYTIRVLPSPNAAINPGTQTICPGSSPVNLTIMSAGPTASTNTYAWSTGATTSSISVSPTATSIYTCVITSTNGCSSTRTSTVVVSQPIVTLNSVPASICPGSSSTITAVANVPGSWQYSWSSGATTNSISTNTSGVYSATMSDGNGCVGTASLNLGTSTTLLLNATTNPSAICTGSSAIVSVVGATSYTWSNGQTNPSIIVTPTVTTTYSVVGEVGTCTGTTSIQLTVSQLPTVTVNSSSSSVCAGDAIQLTASGAATYTWLPSQTLSPSISVMPITNTTYTVRAANPGCPARNATISVNVFALPVINISSSSSLVCAGEAVALAASGAISYAWNTGVTAGVMIVSPTTTNSYTVVGTNANGCKNQANITQQVSECTSISQDLGDNKLNFRVHPNPSSGTFYLETEIGNVVVVINTLGKVIKKLQVDSREFEINLKDEPSGIYFIRVNGSEGDKTTKFLKN